jgi:hypothetical protein
LFDIRDDAASDTLHPKTYTLHPTPYTLTLLDIDFTAVTEFD